MHTYNTYVHKCAYTCTQEPNNKIKLCIRIDKEPYKQIREKQGNCKEYLEKGWIGEYSVKGKIHEHIAEKGKSKIHIIILEGKSKKP